MLNETSPTSLLLQGAEQKKPPSAEKQQLQSLTQLEKSTTSSNHTIGRGAPDGAMPHRRLTLAPGDLSPAATSAGARGSMFSILDVEEAGGEGLTGLDPDDDHVALETAEDVLSDEWIVSRDDVRRPAKSDEQTATEFWDEIRFSTPASRFWERSASSLDSP